MLMIKGEKVTLSPFDSEYSLNTLNWVNNPEIMQLIDRVLPVTQLEHEEWYKDLITNGSSVVFAIINNDDLGHVGNCGLKNIDARSRKAELWIYLGKQFAEKGYGVEAINLLLEYGFNSLNLNRIYLYCIDYNERAINAFKKCNFLIEGKFVEDIYISGKYRDTIRMAILKNNFMKRDGF